MPVLEIEVDTPTNGDLMFEPIQERVRGAFRADRVNNEAAGKLAMRLPGGIPGQRIRIDTETGLGTLHEPLAAVGNGKMRETIAKLVTGDEQATEARVCFMSIESRFEKVHVPTWLAWMIRAVRGGLAKVTAGKLPDQIPADAKLRTYSSASQGEQPDEKDVTIGKLTALLLAKLSPAEKKELSGLLATS
jgi:hypothetical protein